MNDEMTGSGVLYYASGNEMFSGIEKQISIAHILFRDLEEKNTGSGFSHLKKIAGSGLSFFEKKTDPDPGLEYSWIP